MEYSTLSTVFARCHSIIWSYLTVKDVLLLSECSKFTSNVLITSESIDEIIHTKQGSIFDIHRFPIKYSFRFPQQLTLGLFRSVINQLKVSSEATISINESNGRINLSIGNIFNAHDAYLVSEVDVEEEQMEDQEIYKHLEIASYDEYDDFNPRHPMPREKAHRRGDSYFNSDIELVVNELPINSNMDVGAIASSISNVNLNDTYDYEVTKKKGGNDLKSRLLARKKAAQADLLRPLDEGDDGYSLPSTSMKSSSNDEQQCVTLHPYQS